MDLVISIVAYVLAAIFLAKGFQNADLISLLVAAVFTSVGKTYIRRHKEKK